MAYWLGDGFSCGGIGLISQPGEEVGGMPVYLIHFEVPYYHARHYLGYSADLEARVRAHRLGRGARLIEVINEAGIGWNVVRVWEGGRDLEQALKALHNAPRLCPVCQQQAVMEQMEVQQWVTDEVGWYE